MASSTASPTIRRATLADAGDLQRNCFGMSALDDVAAALAEDVAAMDAGRRVRLVAVLDGMVVGNATLFRDEHVLKQHIGSVHDVVVCGVYQGRGIARRLFDRIEVEARALGLAILETSARAGTGAEQVYRRLGFDEYGRLPGGLREPWGEQHIYDQTFFWKRIEEAVPMTRNDHLRRAGAAARNNALWCDAVCRAHGRPGELSDTIWLCRHETPPFYPNAVTLTPEPAVAQLAMLRDLGADLSPPWAVKDSYALLDLAPLGFRRLFDARWIWRPVGMPPSAVTSTADWRTVATAAELRAWERAWSGAPGGEPDAGIFMPALLADPEIAVVGAYQDAQIIAGVIANRSGEVVGMSNVFVAADAAADLWAGCIAAVMAAFPHLPVVGYEGGDELLMAQRHGFEDVGPLSVWSYEGKAA